MGIKNTPLQDAWKIDILNSEFCIFTRDPAKDLAEPSGAPTPGGSALFCLKNYLYLSAMLSRSDPKSSTILSDWSAKLLETSRGSKLGSFEERSKPDE